MSKLSRKELDHRARALGLAHWTDYSVEPPAHVICLPDKDGMPNVQERIYRAKTATEVAAFLSGVSYAQQDR